MPTKKARYVGDGAGTMPRDFSDKLKATLRGYCPHKDAETDPVWGHPTDAFVAAILAEARWAVSELHWQRFDITKSEIRAECADMLKTLKAGQDKLRNLSPDFDRLLGVDADPLGCAVKIEELIRHIQAAEYRIDELPTAKKPTDKQHDVAVEMAIRVLRVLKGNNIKASATGGSYFPYTSKAVQILKAIGNDIGIDRDDLTWRDIIIEAKNAALDLK